MPVATTPMIIPKLAQDGIIEYHKQCYQLLAQQWNIREQMRQIDLAYIREQDLTTANQRAKLANAYGDSSRFQNVTIPIVMPQVESAVEYQSSVFLEGTPIFGVVSSPQFADEALSMETIIDEQSVRGGWTRELQMVFRDGFKYNLGFAEVPWERKVTAALETNLSFSRTEAKPKEIIWEGNAIHRWDPYNTFWDCRVIPAELPEKGEFIGKTEVMGRVALKQLIAALPEKMIDNVKAAFESGMGAVGVPGGLESYFLPSLNPDSLINKNGVMSTDWMAWAGLGANKGVGSIDIAYKNLYEVTTLYGRILPVDFNLKVPARNTAQVWKFIIVNHQVLIYAERQTNAHNKIPVLTAQPNEDGLGYQSKTYAQNVTPLQSTASALMNSVIAARRRAISDRVLYDPSRVTEANINSDNPSAKIPVRPSAYGKTVSDSVYQFPYRDDQSQISLTEIDVIGKLADRTNGQNPARQGQFVKGNKTRKEFTTVMQGSSGRDRMCSHLIQDQFITPMKEILKINILQYQGGISLFNREKQVQVDIDPVKLRKAVLEFKLSDGLSPSEKLINGETLSVAFQTIASSASLAAGYNITPLFSYLMETQGASLKEFEKSAEQVAYETALAQWQQIMTALSEALKELIKKAESMDQAQKAYKDFQTMCPPQPTPDKYGYDPRVNTSNAPSGISSGAAATPGIGAPTQ